MQLSFVLDRAIPAIMVAFDDLPLDILHYIAQSCDKSDFLSLRLSCCGLCDFLQPYLDKQLVSEIRLGLHFHLHRALATPDPLGPEMVIRLLRANAPIDQCDQNGETALHVAARHGNLHTVYRLLKAGAHVDTASSQRWTPLSLASRYGHLEVVRTLLAQGARVDTPGSFGWTALHFARQNGHEECAAVLLEYGATSLDVCQGMKRTSEGRIRQQWGIYQLNVKH